MQVILYSTGCPKCKVLKAKLDSKEISYGIISDTSVMIDKEIETVPVLEVDGNMMDFKTAVDWINNKE